MRLRTALDAMGLPGQIHARTSQLSARLDVDDDLAQSMLQGRSGPPDWLTFDALCRLTNKSPGYFMDPTHIEFPPDTLFVKPYGPGDVLILRIPKDATTLGPEMGAHMLYLRARIDLGFGIRKGDLVVHAPLEEEQAVLFPGQLYVLVTKRNAFVLECTEVSAALATLEPEPHADTATVALALDEFGRPDPASLRSLGIVHIGLVAATVTPSHLLSHLDIDPEATGGRKPRSNVSVLAPSRGGAKTDKAGAGMLESVLTPPPRK